MRSQPWMHYVRRKLLPFAMALALVIGDAAALTVTTATPAQAITYSNLSYPYYNEPCEHSPYTTTGVANYCYNFDWGPTPDTTPGWGEGDSISSYGYGYRNCADYVAWKVASLGVSAAQYKGLGNANQWPSNAPGHGLTVNTIPTAGAAAVKMSGTFGHVAFVESVNSDGTITVSEFNEDEAGDGDTRTGTPGTLGFTQFVHFEAYETSQPSGTTTSTPPPVPWNFETLEGDPHAISPHDGNVGAQPTSITFNSQLFVFYYDVDNGDLRFARTAPGWVFDVLDGEGGPNGRYNANVGNTPTAVVYNNQLHVFYYDATDGNLRHAWTSDGANWSFDNVDGDPGSWGGLDANAGQTPTAIVYNNLLYVFYKDGTNGNLREGVLNGTVWSTFLNLDGDPGSLGGDNADLGDNPSAMIYGTSLQVFYPDNTNGNLRHAWSDDGVNWHFENLDGDVGSISHFDGDVGYHPVALYFGGLHVFYYNRGQGDLRHAWVVSDGWHFENLAGDVGSITGYVGNVGSMTSALNFGGTLQMVTYDSSKGDLVHILYNSTGWHVENLDGSGGSPAGRVNADVGVDSTLVNFGGTLNTFYYDATNGNLRHAWAQ